VTFHIGTGDFRPPGTCLVATRLSVTTRARASSSSARLIGASAGLVRLRGKRVQKFGPHEPRLRLGRDAPVMAMLQQLSRFPIWVSERDSVVEQIDQTPSSLLIQCGSGGEVRICI
jgi:hypothetical protein